MDDLAEARAFFERALAIRERALGEVHPDLARTVSDLAVVYRRQGDYAAARAAMERALAIDEVTLGPRHPELASSLSNLAFLLWSQGEHDAMRQLFLRSARVLSDAADALLPAMAVAEQQSYVLQTLLPWTAVLLNTHRDGAHLVEAYGVAMPWKGVLLHTLRQQTAIAALAGDPSYTTDVARLQALRTEIARAVRRGAPSDALTEEKEALERRLGRALPPDALSDPAREVGVGGLHTALPADAAFADVYYATDMDDRGEVVGMRYLAVVTAPTVPPVLVDLGGGDQLEESVAAWRDAVTAGRTAETATTALAEALWGPLAAALPDGTARVWISPDGDLARVPWAALAAEHTATADLLVAQVPSARDLLTLLAADPGPEAEPSLLLVGGVDFGEGDGFAPLPGTAAEVDALAALADAEGLRTTTLTASEPTAEAVVTALPRATYAHLATHGFFYGESEAAYAARGGDGAFSRTEVLGAVAGPPVAGGFNRNPLAESGLALAGANDDPRGTITAEELVGLDLSGTRLVVLSACETGRGTEVTGQGVLGLQASLTAAGARGLVMSLWKVPDESTALLMEHFYRNLWEGGMAPAAALREAQFAVAADARFSAPVHWAAWVLAGEGW